MRTVGAGLVSAGSFTLGMLLLTAPFGTIVAETRAPVAPPPEVIQALDAMARQPAVAYTAHRRLEGELLKKGEQAWMEVTTVFEPGRGLTHTVLAEGGSARIRGRALSKVLEKEIEASRADEARQTAFSSDNYQYRLIDAPVERLRIELVPRRSDVRLVKGMAIVDAEDCRLRRVEGQLAEHPSFWVRDVHIERTYGQFGQVTLPVDMVTTARIRLFGDARLRVQTKYIAVDGRSVQ